MGIAAIEEHLMKALSEHEKRLMADQELLQILGKVTTNFVNPFGTRTQVIQKCSINNVSATCVDGSTRTAYNSPTNCEAIIKAMNCKTKY